MGAGHALVVDDDETIREVAQMALELVGGWRVTTAADGAEAVELARTHRPDVVLLDVMLPRVDGPAILSMLRAESATRDIPIIYLTAKATPGREEEWSQTGATGVIAKPFDPMTLADDVARLIGRDT
ncbi:response regulator [Georgenia sp. SUBG003]|uniref:response regulator n=1 Tax=Georgenia sp. SUBG003 TaxID=1497974 RepID=UPI0004D8C1B9|nr:chemotaxis protein CheY [Georgenia sp. SUBG003]